MESFIQAIICRVQCNSILDEWNKRRVAGPKIGWRYQFNGGSGGSQNLPSALEIIINRSARTPTPLTSWNNQADYPQIPPPQTPQKVYYPLLQLAISTKLGYRSSHIMHASSCTITHTFNKRLQTLLHSSKQGRHSCHSNSLVGIT